MILEAYFILSLVTADKNEGVGVGPIDDKDCLKMAEMVNTTWTIPKLKAVCLPPRNNWKDDD